ncbi:MAG: hypothetical protein HY549_11790 [Elusimicrobia bacterium]|nr:hypothetical protein [Elusimicrobiota bacterium]
MEVLPPKQSEPEPQAKLHHLRALGLLGTLLALLTMLAAFGIGLIVFFGSTLAATLVAMLVWPMVFSPEFTQWVFGSPEPGFRKLFLLFLVIGMIAKLFRPMEVRSPLWPRK